jgi:hypothetical protein
MNEHLHATIKRLKKLGVRRGDCVASALPEGPDAATAGLALATFDADYAPLRPSTSRLQYESLLREIDPQLLLLHPAEHLARQAALDLGIPVANVLRHFEAGIFTLEAALNLPPRIEAPRPAWKLRGVPLVLIAPGSAYLRLANRLDATNPVIGITAPLPEHLPLPHTIEHIAAECVRILRRSRPTGPYALAGWQTDAVVALEMARLLEEQGERIAFVAMLDASELFGAHRAFLRKKYKPSCVFMEEALRQYRPRPWFGKILHIRPNEESARDPWFRWSRIAPHGLTSYEALPSNLEAIAEIFAAELVR